MYFYRHRVIEILKHRQRTDTAYNLLHFDHFVPEISLRSFLVQLVLFLLLKLLKLEFNVSG